MPRQIPLNLARTPSPGSTLARRFAVHSRPTSGAPCTELQNPSCANENGTQVSAFLATGVDVYALSTTLSNECSTLPPRGKDDLMLPQSRLSNVRKIVSSRAEIQSLNLAPTSVRKDGFSYNICSYSMNESASLATNCPDSLSWRA